MTGSGKPGGGDDIAAELAALSAEYVAGLPRKYQELAASVEQAREGSSEAREEVLELAHRLHGTAGSYGLARVSAAAGRLEEQLLQQRESGGGWGEVDRALQELQAAVTTP